MSVDKDGYLNSTSRVYANVDKLKGPEWSNYKSFVPKWNPPTPYRIFKKVGHGKYSTVYKACDSKGKFYAIKVLVPLDPKRYLREMKILTNLKGGPNIVQLEDLVYDPPTNIYSYVLEWVEFSDWKAIYYSLSVDDVRLYMYKLLVALDFSHSNGIIHRDIKPQNIAIDTKNQRLRLLDWGLADFYSPHHRYNSHVGTRAFKSPELLLEYPYYDYSMDIWAAGLTMAAMLFHAIPVKSGSDDDQQLFNVADLVGGQKIIEYADALNIQLTDDAIEDLQKKKGMGWGPFMKKSPGRASEEALDLLNKMVCVDHRNRISAHEAIFHPFIRGADEI